MELKIESLKKEYGEKVALDIPELTIQSGELVGLVGNNGAGKTTLLRLVLDLIKATEGRVYSNGIDVSAPAPTRGESEAWKYYTGSFVDGRFLIDFYTPEEYFALIGRLYGIPQPTIDQRLNRQKIGIIGAMLIHPKVLLLDEPFNYLDPSSQIVVARLIQQMNRDLGTTVIISSHNLNFVSDISTRILLLEKGHVIKDLLNNEGSATQELNDYFSGEA